MGPGFKARFVWFQHHPASLPGVLGKDFDTEAKDKSARVLNSGCTMVTEMEIWKLLIPGSNSQSFQCNWFEVQLGD